MTEIIELQHHFFNSNKTKDVDFRITQLTNLKKGIESHLDNLYTAIYADFKKSNAEVYNTEIKHIIADIEIAISNVKNWAEVEETVTNGENAPAKSYIISEPLGSSLIIGAWNYPYMLSLAPVVAAMAAGCTIILKPSELPASTSNAMANMVKEYFDPAYFTVIEGGVNVTTALLDQKFDKIFFTGSIPVGKIVYQAAAKNLTPVTLELGGKSPVFFTETADISKNIKSLVRGKFLNAGQTCIAPDYILVHESVKEKFLEAVKTEIENTNYSLENQNITQIINERNVERLTGLIDKNKIFIGGKVDKDNRFIEPTVLKDVTFEDKIMQDEIFGPIMPVISYTNLDEMITKVKSRPKPLACYIYTEDQTIKNKILHEVSFGGGAVNETLKHITNPNLPFGGVGESGTGSYHGKAGFIAFSHFKSILDK